MAEIVTHPSYQKMRDQWDYLRDMHDNRDIADQYLVQHMTESNAAFQQRQNMANSLYRNWPAFVTSVYASNLWSMPPRRTLPASVLPLVHNIDRRSTEADVFFKNVCISAMVEGVAHVLVDMPVIDESAAAVPQTKANAQQLGITPYCVLLRPQDIVNWNIEDSDPMRMGQLNWVVIKGQKFDGMPTPHKTPNILTTYTIWRPLQWELWVERTDKQGNTTVVLERQGEHPFGEVPLVQFYDKRLTDMIGVSSISDIAPLAQSLFNKLSTLDTAERWSSMPYLVITSNIASLDTLRLDQFRAIKLAQGDEMKYVSPLVDVIESIRQSCYDIVTDIVRLAIRQVEPSGQAGESTDKVRIDRHELISSLKEKADNFEDAETQVWRLILRGVRRAPITDRGEESELNIVYNKRFIHETVSEQLAGALNIRDLSIPSPTFQELYLTHLAHNVLDGMTEQELTQIAEELRGHLAQMYKNGDADLNEAKDLINKAASLIKLKEMQRGDAGLG